MHFKKQSFLSLTLISLLHAVYPFAHDICQKNNFIRSFDISWDNTTSPIAYQREFCSMRCNGDSRVDLNVSRCWNIECIPCYCQRPACQIYDNCCPDISVPFRRGSFKNQLQLAGNSSEDHKNQDIARQDVACELLFPLNKAYSFVKTCLSSYSANLTVKDLCEREMINHEATVEAFLRVFDPVTHVVYKNMYCATCSEAENFTALPAEISTKSFMPFYKAKSRDEILQQLLQDGSKILFLFPENLTRFDCVLPTTMTLVSKCQESDRVEDHVVSACESLTGERPRVYNKLLSISYTNIFCAICNLDSLPFYTRKCDCHTHQDVFGIDPLPFTLLLDLRKRSEPAGIRPEPLTLVSYCSIDQWLSPDGVCLQLACAPGKRVYHGECIEIMEQVKGLSYSLRLWLEPVYTADLTQPNNTLLSASAMDDSAAALVVDTLMTKLKQMMIGLSGLYSIDIKVVQDNTSRSLEFLEDSSNLFVVNLKINAQLDIVRSEFETKILHRLVNREIFVTFADLSMSFQTYPTLHAPNLSSDPELLTGSTLYTTKGSLDIDFHSTEFIYLSEVLNCQHVRFDKNDYSLTVDGSFFPPNITIAIYFKVKIVYITDYWDFSRVEIDGDGILNICQDLLDSKLKEADKDNIQQDLLNRKLKGTSLAEYIVSITCCVASIVCLLMTLLTYFMFPVLRTEAGINNMFLSCSLLLAQVSLLATAHILRSSVICTVVGITTHFFWLWMFSWGFICSLHMFRVFTACVRRTTSQNDMFGVWKKVLASVAFPILVIVATILSSYWTSDGREIGYGRFSCYLNSNLLVGVTLVGPLSAMAVTNILLFINTVCKIHSVRNLQTSFRNVDQRSQWYVYVRLFSVTGGFWTVAILASALDSEILKILAIILNGLQGVAIFISFICNKKIMQLYCQLRQP